MTFPGEIRKMLKNEELQVMIIDKYGAFEVNRVHANFGKEPNFGI